MAPIVPIIGAVIATVGTVAATAMSNKAAKEQQKRQLDYQQQLNAEQRATQAQEQQLQTDSKNRTSAYALSLLDNNTTLNSLSGIPDDEQLGSFDNTSLSEGAGGVTTNQQTGVQSMFA